MSIYANGPAVISLSAVLPALGMVFVAGRFFIRKTHNQGFDLDDWFILPALLAAIAMGITIIIGATNYSVGYPAGIADIGELTPQLILVQQVFLAVGLINIFGLMFAKLSVLCFYRRIFYTGSGGIFDYITKALFVFIVGWAISFFLGWLFQCGTDISVQWGSYEDQMAQCFNPQTFNLSYVVTDLFVDVVLFILPIPLVLHLSMSLARRLAVIFVFSLGALTLVASAIRVVFFGFIYSGIDNSILNQDPILNISVFLYWTMLEEGMAVIVACLPTFQVWIRKISVEAVVRNVRGVFSLPSSYRISKMSTHARTKPKEADSSTASLQQQSYQMMENKEGSVSKLGNNSIGGEQYQ